MALRRVGEHQIVRPLLVSEVIVDSLLLHQPACEGEVALAILHAVIALVETPLDLVIDRQAGEHLLEDLRDALVLEDAALNALGPQPELRDHLGAIVDEVVVAAALTEAVHQSMKMTLAAAGEVELNLGRAPKDLREIRRLVARRNQLQRIRKQLRDRFAAAKCD